MSKSLFISTTFPKIIHQPQGKEMATTGVSSPMAVKGTEPTPPDVGWSRGVLKIVLVAMLPPPMIPDDLITLATILVKGQVNWIWLDRSE
jgi:hypothetical protein